ncbi:hypothetical protein DFP72DRAFT_267327, partial [Ephemerocybe angulata]
MWRRQSVRRACLTTATPCPKATLRPFVLSIPLHPSPPPPSAPAGCRPSASFAARRGSLETCVLSSMRESAWMCANTSTAAIHSLLLDAAARRRALLDARECVDVLVRPSHPPPCCSMWRLGEALFSMRESAWMCANSTSLLLDAAAWRSTLLDAGECVDVRAHAPLPSTPCRSMRRLGDALSLMRESAWMGTVRAGGPVPSTSLLLDAVACRRTLLDAGGCVDVQCAPLRECIGTRPSLSLTLYLYLYLYLGLIFNISYILTYFYPFCISTYVTMYS